MLKKNRILSFTLATILLITSFTLPSSSAFAGRPDSSGGIEDSGGLYGMGNLGDLVPGSSDEDEFPPDNEDVPPDDEAIPPDGEIPPDDDETPPVDGETPPDDGTTPPVDGETPPDDGETPPDDGTTPPVDGETPPDDGETPPVDGETPPDDGETPPVDGETPPDAETPTPPTDESNGIAPIAANECIVTFFKDSSFHDRIGEPVVIPKGNPLGTVPALPEQDSPNQKVLGWGDSSGKIYTANSIVTSDLNLYPIVKKYYTITFKDENSTIDTITGYEGQTIGEACTVANKNFPSNPTSPSGATFKGWYTGSLYSSNLDPWYDGTRITSGTKISGDLTVNSLMVYEIKFDVNGGKFSGNYVNTSYTVQAGKEFRFNPQARYEGDIKNVGGVEIQDIRKFTGWYTSQSGGTPRMNHINYYTPTQSETLYAQYEQPSSNKYTVTLKTDGCSGATGDIVITDVAEGAVIKSFPNVSQAGKTPDGWEANGEKWVANETQVKGNVTITPRFKDSVYKVTFTIPGGETKTLSNVKHGSKLDSSQAPSIPSDSTIQTLFMADSTGNLIEYTVTYKFTGEWVGAGTGGKWNFDTDTVNADMTLTAASSITYDPPLPPDFGDSSKPCEVVTVKFDHRNENKDISTFTIRKGENPEKLAPTPTRKGYTLKGWSIYNGDWNTSYPYKFVPLNENLTLYAIWEKKVDVEFNSDGGHYVSAQTVAYGETVSEPEPPKKDFYTFVGWSTERQKTAPSTEIKKFDFSTSISKTMAPNGLLVLWAWYKPNTIIRYDYNFDGTDRVDEVGLEEGQGNKIPPHTPAIEPAGMALDSWYTHPTGGNDAVGQPVSIGKTTTVYAHWVDGFTITYVVTPSENIKHNYKVGTEVTSDLIPEIEQRDNKIVTGWYKEKECTNLVDFSQIKEDTIVYAKWEAIVGGTVTVTFDANSGKFGDGQTEFKITDQTKGALIPESKRPANPNKAGMNFGSWYLDKNYTKSVNFSTYKPTKDVTLYARWMYEVTFIPFKDCAGNLIKNDYAADGATVARPITPMRTGLDFHGWTTDQNANGSSKLWNFWEDTIKGKTTLYGVWNATLRFDANGGEGTPEAIKVWENSTDKTVSKPTNPTKADAIFKGWYTDDNFTTPFHFKGEETPTSVDHNMTIYAKWEEKSEVTVTFNTDGGKPNVPSQTIAKGSLATKPSDEITKKGYRFVGWYNGETEFDFNQPVNSSITVTAKWEELPEFTVSFDTDGGTPDSIESQTVVSGEKAKKPKDPEKEGHTFGGWLNGNTLYDFDQPVTSNLDLTAKWDTIPMVTVTFDTNGGQPESIPVQTIQTGTTATEPDEPTREGYTFEGWFNGNDEFNFKTKVTENITLVAKWEIIPMVTVTFDTNGGQPESIPAQTIVNGTTATKPSEPTREGYTFEGWFNGNDKFNFRTKVTENITLVAKWEIIPMVTVSFDTAGGQPETIPAQTIVSGTTATEPSEPTREGYTFEGWFNGSKKFSFKTKVKEDITLVAKWEAIPVYTVSFDTDGGQPETIPEQKIQKDGLAVEPAAPTKDGYEFGGWYIGKKKFDFTTKITKDIQLVAEWIEEEYCIVKLHVQGEGKPKEVKVKKGAIMDKPADPVRAGYSFDGWYHGNKKFDFTQPVTEDINLQAKWTHIKTGGTIIEGITGGGSVNDDPYTVERGSSSDDDRSSGSSSSSSSSSSKNSSLNSSATAVNKPVSVKLTEKKSTVTRSKLKNIVSQNKKKDVTLTVGKFSYTFKKGTMKLPTTKKSFDFGAKVQAKGSVPEIKKLAGDAELMTVHYNYEGKLPAKAQINIPVGKEHTGKTLYYYYYNKKTKNLEYIQNGKVDKKGNLIVEQTHCSDYVITTKLITQTTVVPSTYESAVQMKQF